MAGDTCFFNTFLYREAGLKHKDENRSCEDNVSEAFHSKTGVKAIALSDGAGSCKNAAVGSEITSRAAARFLADKFELLYELDSETCAVYILQKVLEPLKNMADKNGWDIESLSATLLCAACHPDGRYLLFHVGDGAIVGYLPAEGCKALSLYEHDGPANQTTFVTVPGTSYQLQKGRKDYASFILMSDGPEDFLVNEASVNSRVELMHQFSFVLTKDEMEKQLKSLVQLLNNNGMYDDVSFAIISDQRKIADVFDVLSPQLREILFGIGSKMNKKAVDKYKRILRECSLHPEGVPVSRMRRILHMHSKRITRKKMVFYVVMKMVQKRNGRYYLR